jgi:hypothetical protein
VALPNPLVIIAIGSIEMDRNSRATIPVVLFVALVLTPRVGITQAAYSHGTCAIFSSNHGNMAMVVDSAFTVTDSHGDVVGHELGCKTFLPNKITVAVTTGIASLGGIADQFARWDSEKSARSLLSNISADPTTAEVEFAMKSWSDKLIAHSKAHPGEIPTKIGEVASLLVGFRSRGKAYIYRERVQIEKGVLSAVPARFDVNGGYAVLYGGSCRNFILIDGKRPIQISVEEASRLNHDHDLLNSEKTDSALKLGEVSREYLQAFIDISTKHPSDPRNPTEIGPPIQLATLASNSDHWITPFVDPCLADALPPKLEEKPNSKKLSGRVTGTNDANRHP